MDVTDDQIDWNDAAAIDALAARMDTEDAERHARLTRPEALANAALWYAGHGVPCFPLKPRHKVPLTANGFKDATTDTTQVRDWWTRWPHANIGMPTGLLADVIDIDGPVGVANIAPYVESIRARCIGIVSTPRPGGLHYYVPPGERKNSASKLLRGVDTRATGGYVVLPPSVTDEHGPDRRYTWLRPLDTTAVA